MHYISHIVCKYYKPNPCPTILDPNIAACWLVALLAVIATYSALAMVSITQELVLCAVAIFRLFGDSHEALSSKLAGRAACVGENVTLTFDVLETGILTWIIGSSDKSLNWQMTHLSPLRLTPLVSSLPLSSTTLKTSSTFFLGNLTSTLHTHQPFRQ